jgi:hypothetical protein
VTFEPTISVLERAKTVRALDRAATAIGFFRDELEKAKYVSIMIDSSNHGALKIVPVLVRYFIPEEGIKTMVIEFLDLPCEAADQLT